MGAFAKNAKTILTRSLADIEAGAWKRGAWGHGKTNGKCEVEGGCANGLISMHGGHVEFFELSGKKTHITPVPANRAAYKRETERYEDAPPGVVKATKAVFEALPRKYREDTLRRQRYLGPPDLDVLVNAIIGWNDSTTTTRAKARDVFRKAIELLPTIK